MSELTWRLGLGETATAVIITADDFGLCHAANVGVIESMTTGLATSASLLVPGPWAKQAAATYRGQDLGVLLAITAEHELLRFGPITHAPSLLGGDGGFAGSVADALDHADLDEVRKECRAQLERAILYGIDQVQQGLQRTIQENRLPDGTAAIGSFVVTVDDGSGAPSASLMHAVGAAVETMRPVGARYAVMAPSVTTAAVSLSATPAPDASGSDVRGAVAAAITAHINGLGLGVPLVWSRLIQVAYDASPLVAGIEAVLVNGDTRDIVPGPGAVVKPGGVVVS